MLTVFTPVYNRAYIIRNLYESLCRQSDKDFEWIVVDDGSSDDIDAVMNGFISEGKVDIRYFKQSNGGKHRAINLGVKNARGDFFFIVDSDDYITDDAIEWINKTSRDLKEKRSFAGFSGLRVNPDGTKMDGGPVFDIIESDAIDIRLKHKVPGELAEVYRTSVLKDFPFPDIPGEKFCSEGLVWRRIALAGYGMKYFYKPLIVCEYRADGLTMSRVGNRRLSPEYSMLLYKEGVRCGRYPMKLKLKNALLYWRYSEKSERNFMDKAKDIPFFYWPLYLPAVILRRAKR